MSTSNLLTFGDRTSRQGNLYTIYEESETVKSESSMAPPRSTFEEENKSRPLPRESHASEGEEPDTATSSDGPYHPRLFWPYQKVEPTFDRALVGDEEACRQRFMQMIQSVYASHNECKDPVPRDIEVVFDGQDNVQFIRFAIHGRTEQHKFTGISQFIPPEVAMAEGPRSCELADVWILGINLYRMLIGKFPFAGSNDRKIFKKMLHAEFRIPQGYSEDFNRCKRFIITDACPRDNTRFP
ncbi:hypothetical protein BX666DRAFT_1505813 [Dichotomocladium elegans]|nr:hypothetical protein BX666DRAFT_1505813 [Dichotomocladium elegans]